MPIKAFVFDCGGVLLSDGDLSPYELWAKRAGSTPEKLKEFLWQSDLWRRTERGEVSDAEFWRVALDELGLGDVASASEFKQDIWKTWKIDTRVVAIVDELRKRYPVSMLSNASDDLERVLAEKQVADRFDHIINSARVGVAKPDRRVFDITLEKLGLESQQVVFIDDKVENIAAAAALGLHVIWYVGASELERRLSLLDHCLSFNSLS